MGFSFKGIGKAISKLQNSDNKMLKGVRDFGEGMADAPAGSSVGERLAGGGMGVGGGIIKSKFDNKKMPNVMHDPDPRQSADPVIDRAPPPMFNNTEERRKRSAITRGLRMNQLDPAE